MKARNWGLIAAISALFLTLLAIPAISNSDNSDIVASESSQPPIATQTPTQNPDGRLKPSHSPAPTPSAEVTSSPTSPEPKSDKEDGIEIPREFLKRLIGMNESDAKALIYENNYMSRVVHRDGEDFMVTADFRFDRVNLYISGGIVFDATAG